MIAIIVAFLLFVSNQKMQSIAFNLELPVDKLFTQFKTKYSRHYSPTEEQLRFQIFKNNLKNIKALNEKRTNPSDALHDINMYTDLIDDELPMNKGIPVPVSSYDKEHFNSKELRKVEKPWNEIPPLPSGDSLPQNHAFCGEYVSKNTDRPKVDLCGEVFSQQNCGGCWAISLANLAQYLYSNLTYQRYGCVKTPPKFSAQRFLDVTTTKATKRCCGGHPRDAVNAVKSFSLDADYPFVDGSNRNLCTIRGDQNPSVQIQMAITGYKTFGISKDQNMVLILKKLLHHYGPFLVSVKVSGTGFSSYSSGIFSFPSTSVCDTSSSSFMTDHEVVLMGWGVENGIEYFIIRNSWSSGWGEGDNYIRIKTTNLCGIGWRIGDYVYPLNMIVYANTCKFDKYCNSCNISSNICSSCTSGYSLNSNNKCVENTVKLTKFHSNSTNVQFYNHTI
ncbi:cysteine proteinase precursor, putative [Entamoeba dispar SAW760]|uniref:Cysteine proteinase, putative n=1 Tax=Entamoeba dispar (strain ATCC PRA-260 / SAW760) TaxID=370354 RepID=B0EQW6_ENTDS|nr:cysteine proteinase precursor, putative [Entamoeba dispar SAW760]EDR23079.1 cysteine proteinase precursor, putative [Entamoeba dispar SAW760]|eukprot:EDR23079.1 cysteine proteinase precursor, putative [Entamoeba dispar SAW760]